MAAKKRAQKPKVSALKTGVRPPSYRDQGTQVTAADLSPTPWRVVLGQVWTKLRPAVLWLGEAGVFLLSRVNFGFGYGINYIPFLGLNANNRGAGASPPPSPR